jgi:hypothetical protein
LYCSTLNLKNAKYDIELPNSAGYIMISTGSESTELAVGNMQYASLLASLFISVMLDRRLASLL